MYQWLYGIPLSGLSFPLITASGTFAKGYDSAQLSGVISKDGGAWGTIGNRLSGIPGDGVYTIAALSSTEMTCFSWIIKITANSGCLDQTILGYNLSGYPKFSDLSGFAHSLDCSGNNAILVAVSAIPLAVASGWNWVACSGNDKLLSAISGLKNDVSGLPGILVAVSAIPLAIASGWNWVACSGNDKLLSAISGHKNDVSGLPGILVAVSAIPLAVASGWNWVACSGNDKILVAVSGLRNDVSGLPGILVATSSSDISGIASQVWKTVYSTYTSSVTYGGSVILSGGYVTVSGLAALLDAINATPNTTASGFAPILVAVSGLKNDMSGLPGILTAASAPCIIASAYHSGATIMAVANSMSGTAPTPEVDISSIAAQVWNSLKATFTSTTTFADLQNGTPAEVDVSTIAAQTWNSLITTYTSSTTFGGMVAKSGVYATVSGLLGLLNAINAVPNTTASGFAPILVAISSIPLVVASGWNWVACSGNDKILSTVSGCASGIASQVWNTIISVHTSNTTFGAMTTSGMISILTAVSGITSGCAAQVWNSEFAAFTSSTTFGGGVTSGIARQVWNTLVADCTSSTTFGGSVSGLARRSDCSGLNNLLYVVSTIPLAVASGWNWTACSGSDKILSAISGLKNDVSGLPGILTAASAPCIIASAYHSGATIMAVANSMSGTAPTPEVDISSIAAQVWNSLKATYTSTTTFGDLQNGAEPTINVSSIAAQVWNSITNTYTSSTTFGGFLSGFSHSLDCSGIHNVLVCTSAIPLAVASGWVGCSGNNGLLTAINAVPNNVASGFAPILTATSGVPAAAALRTASGFAPILTAVSAVPNNTASGFAPVLNAVSGVPANSASQTWNAYRDAHNLSGTFGETVVASGLTQILNTISGLKNDVSGIPGLTVTVADIDTLVHVSGLSEILTAVSGLGVNVLNISGLTGILTAISACPYGVIVESVADATTLASGTVGHTLRLLRWYSWDNLYIDKTFTPARLYLKTDGTNYSSWWEITDNASQTTRIRGG